MDMQPQTKKTMQSGPKILAWLTVRNKVATQVQNFTITIHMSLTEQQWHIERKQNNEFYSMYHPI